MKKTIKFSFVFLIAFCFAILPCMTMIAQAQTTLSAGSLPSTPTLTSPQSNQSYTSSDICVRGFTQTGTYVEVYINDKYDGQANVSQSETETSVFDYCKPFGLAPGYHSISVRAVNAANSQLKSDFASAGLKIVNYAAPILQKPEGQVTTKKPAVEGLAPSGAVIEIFFDNLSYGTYQAGTHSSGTAGFSVVVDSDLNYDKHTVYVIATSPDGTKVSERSNTLEFEVVVPGAVSPAPLPTPTPTPTPDAGLAYPAPTLLEPSGAGIISNQKPEIKGVAYNNSIVDIFIDGKPNGTIKVGSHPSGTAGFTYKPFLELSAGAHNVFAIARNETGKKSKVSNTLTFQTGNYYPAPVISNTSKTIIELGTEVVQGVVKNNSIVKVYIDNKYYGELNAGSHLSGTVSFAYELNKELSSGAHTLYTIALDGSGKSSKWSNIISFNYEPPIIEEIKTEETESVPETIPEETPVAESSEESVAVTTESGDTSVAATKETESTKKTEEPIKPAVTKLSTDNDETGASSDQGKSVGLIVLIAVIVLLVLWFFWVNKDYFIKKAKVFEKKAEVIEGELEKEVKGPEAVTESETEETK